jgi:hypothetical protein
VGKQATNRGKTRLVLHLRLGSALFVNLHDPNRLFAFREIGWIKLSQPQMNYFTHALSFELYRRFGSARTGQVETTPNRPVSRNVRTAFFIVSSLFVCGPALADQGGENFEHNRRLQWRRFSS